MLKSPRLTALIEVISFVAFAMILKWVLDDYFWRYSGPVSLITTLTVLTGYLNYRGENWTSMGLQALPGAKAKLKLIRQILITFGAFFGVLAFVVLGSEVLGLEFMAETPEGVEERWGDIKGNLQLYLVWFAISWISGGFAEEMFFRGFVITRLQTVFADAKFASILAVVLAALLFGYLHFYYQGMRGFVTTGAIALVFGGMYLFFKRNLWPVIFVHGFIDALGFTARFFDWDV